MKIENLTKDNFKATIEASRKPVIIDFYADWCMPCKMITPILEEIATENKDGVAIYKVNIDENQELAVEFSVRSIPNIMSFKEGKVYKTIVGVQPKEVIKKLID